MIIYKATNIINEKCYIGQTVKTLNARISGHKNSAQKIRDCSYFHNAIKKYGIENFKWEIIDVCNDRKELNEKESFYIKKYNTIHPNGYNLTWGGESGIPSAETRKKLSLSRIGMKFTEEHKRNLSLAKKGKIPGNIDILHEKNRGLKRTKEHIKKYKIAQSNRSFEWRKNIRLAKLGDKNPNYGKHRIKDESGLIKYI